jgi:hypothetical protein
LNPSPVDASESKDGHDKHTEGSHPDEVDELSLLPSSYEEIVPEDLKDAKTSECLFELEVCICIFVCVCV